MAGNDDEHRAREARRAGKGAAHEDRDRDFDSPLLHPANEGHDKERKLDQMEAWDREESADADEARRAREKDRTSHAQGGPLGNERFVDQTPEPPPPEKKRW